MKTLLRYCFPPFLFCFFIFMSSSKPNIQVSHDKILHTLAYAGMAFLFARAISAHTRVVWKIWLFAFLISVLYGLGDEFHQSFVPGRNMSLDDVVADALGASLGGLAYVSLIQLPKFRPSNR